MNLELIKIESQLKTAMSLMRTIQFLKILLAMILTISYFYYHEWLTEILVASVVVVLILPLGFFDGYITSLLEYHNHLVRESQDHRAKALETVFKEVADKIELLENNIETLTIDASNNAQ